MKDDFCSKDSDIRIESKKVALFKKQPFLSLWCEINKFYPINYAIFLHQRKIQ